MLNTSYYQRYININNLSYMSLNNFFYQEIRPSLRILNLINSNNIKESFRLYVHFANSRLNYKVHVENRMLKDWYFLENK